MQSPHGSAYHPLASITGCSGESGYRLSIPVFWASVGDFFGRKSFGAIRGNMNLFYTWGSILGPFIAGAVYDRTQSYELVFTGITISLLISTAMTALLIKPWADLEASARTSIH